MSISFRCTNPECGKACRAQDEHAGRTVRCPGCGERLTVPSAKAPSSAKPSARPAAARAEGTTSAPAASTKAPTPATTSTPLPENQQPAPAASAPLARRASRSAAALWLAAMAGALLVGAGGGYVLAMMFHGGSDSPDATRLAESNRDLMTQLAAAEQQVKDAQAANADLASRLADAPSAAPVAADDREGELTRLRAELQTAQAEAALAKEELARLSIATVPPATTPDPQDAQRDLDNIRGVWKSVDDRVFPFSQPIVIASYQDQSLFNLSGMVLNYKLDPTQSPKTIDLYSERENRTFTGIYELNGELLNIAVHLDGQTRPKDFVLSEQDKLNDSQGKSSKWAFSLRRESR